MAKLKGLQLLLKRKVQLDSSGELHPEFKLREIANDAAKAARNQSELDIFPVRIVAIAEVLFRRIIRDLVQASREHARRGAELIASAKPDFEVLLSVVHDELTFGDIVAHTVPFNHLEDVFGAIEKLTNEKLAPHLSTIQGHYEIRKDFRPTQTIEDYAKACIHAEGVFAFRHRVCHEGLSGRDPELVGLEEKVESFARFFTALDDYVRNHIYPNLPTTQLEMNDHATESLNEARVSMDRYLDEVRERYKENPDQIKNIETAQAAWESFVVAQQAMRYHPGDFGTIHHILWADEAERLTRERVDLLKWYAKRKEGDM